MEEEIKAAIKDIEEIVKSTLLSSFEDNGFVVEGKFIKVRLDAIDATLTEDLYMALTILKEGVKVYESRKV